LSKKGHNVTVLQANSMDLPSEEVYEGFKIIRVKSVCGDKLYGFHPELFPFIKKYYKCLKPDIIHVHGYHTLFSPELIILFKKIYPDIPLIFSPHFGISSHSTFGGKYLWTLYNKLIGNKIIKTSNLILAASNFEATNLYSIMHNQCNKIIIVPHGVDIVDLSRVDRKRDRINLLYVGYLLELKGVQYVIESLHELVYNKGFKVKLTIVGKGPYEYNLKKLANKLNVNDFIDWVGFIPSNNLVEYYKNADIFLFTSKSENYGIVVGEALASGTPVIVTKIPALMEFLDEPGCFGVEYPPEPVKLSELIIYINSTNTKVGPFSDKIRTWDEVASNYEQIYEKCLFLGSTAK
jgi:glycosyltransferase involved in cell wall biosynthesis